mgnify:CR=1 FL=1
MHYRVRVCILIGVLMNTDKDEDNTSRDIVVTLSYERKVSKRLVMSKLNLCTMLCL